MCAEEGEFRIPSFTVSSSFVEVLEIPSKFLNLFVVASLPFLCHRNFRCSGYFSLFENNKQTNKQTNKKNISRITETALPKDVTWFLKCPCLPKWLCALVLLLWNGSFVECGVLIGSHFPSDNFHLREIPAMHAG